MYIRQLQGKADGIPRPVLNCGRWELKLGEWSSAEVSEASYPRLTSCNKRNEP